MLAYISYMDPMGFLDQGEGGLMILTFGLPILCHWIHHWKVGWRCNLCRWNPKLPGWKPLFLKWIWGDQIQNSLWKNNVLRTKSSLILTILFLVVLFLDWILHISTVFDPMWKFLPCGFLKNPDPKKSLVYQTSNPTSFYRISPVSASPWRSVLHLPLAALHQQPLSLLLVLAHLLKPNLAFRIPGKSERGDLGGVNLGKTQGWFQVYNLYTFDSFYGERLIVYIDLYSFMLYNLYFCADGGCDNICNGLFYW